MASIAVEDVSKVYPDGTQAVSGVSLDVPDGAVVVLVGPSGCGKTSLLRMIAGLERITDGVIRIGERVVNDVPAKHRDIAMVFQNYALYPHMSVRDNVTFGLRLRRLPRKEIDDRLQTTARMLALIDKLDKKPKALSGGQRQRVAMGRAIVREPQAFLMDEPLSNLDAKLRVQMRAEIGRMQKELGITTVFVTHDQTEAMTLGDLVAVMRRGVIQQIATPQELFERPANVFVAGFIGSPAMNLVEARLEREDGHVDVVFGEVRLRVPNAVLAARPRLAEFIGRPVALGIRPEDMEDASLRELPPGSTLRARVELRETLGREAYLHFSVNAPPVLTEDVRELSADSDAAQLEDLEKQRDARTGRLVARVSARTSAPEENEVVLGVDTSCLHFFDAATGEAI